MPKRLIKLLGEPIQNEDYKAAAAITPGMLVDLNGGGDLVPHATAGGYTTRWFAMEREEMGMDIDTTYATGDTVKVGAFGPGTRVNALLASGISVAKGGYLESNGDGSLRAYAAGTRLARALEAIDNTASTSLARIRAEVV